MFMAENYKLKKKYFIKPYNITNTYSQSLEYQIICEFTNINEN